MNENIKTNVPREHKANKFIKDTKFFLMEVKYGRYYSQKDKKYEWFKSSKGQVWLNETTPCSGICVNLYEIVDLVPKNVKKDERWVVKSFNSTEFPLKDRTPLEKHNMCIIVDLDLDKSEKLKRIFEHDKDIYNKIYEYFDLALRDFLEKNYMYAEQSSSKVGIHAIFGFDIEANEVNFHKLAKYVKNKIFENIDNYITGFSEVLNEDKVFDRIYDRPYQKYFITGVNSKFNDNCTGHIDLGELETITIKEKTVDTLNYDIVRSDIKLKAKSLEVDYYGRLYAATALKRITKTKEEWEKLWWQICEVHYHSDHDTKSLFKEFNYDGLDETTGHVNRLDKYGIKYNKSIIYHNLNDDMFLGDILEQILNETSNGVNMLISGTGTGKNHSWITYNRNILNNPMEINNHKPILIIEPLNSIVESKYNADEVEVIIGNKKFPKELYNYKMYITNYNKLLSKTLEGKWKLKDDIDDFLSKFELIVVDESHIIIKDLFRADVLIPFIDTINKVGDKTKIILQTATPAGEEHLFDIKNTLNVTKKPKADIKYIFRRFRDEVDGKKIRFNIQDINCLTSYYRNCGRKVYIYWQNASLQQLQSFKQTYCEPDKVAIFHKRNSGEKSMEKILNEHELGNEYDILLSSVYFGVGNDLNDKTDAAVIIIGNNMWQEDIQAIGRWRNSKDIEVCTILLENDYKFIKETDELKTSWNDIFYHQLKVIRYLWEDKTNRDKSLIIKGKAYQLNKEEDIRILAVLRTAEIYYSSYHVKIDSLKDNYYGIDVREDYSKFLECNDDYNEKLKSFNNGLKNIRNDKKKEIVEGKVDWNEINRDSRLERFTKMFNKCKLYGIDKLLPIDFITKQSNENMLELFIKYYRATLSGNCDYAELYSLLWYRENFTEDCEFNLLERQIDSETYYSTLAYVLFAHNKNKTDKDFILKSNYYGTLKWQCKLFYKVPDELIDMFYDKNDYSNSFEFMSQQGWSDIDFEKDLSNIIKSMDDVKNKTSRMTRTEKEVYNVVKFCLEYNHQKESSKESNAKEVVITDQFPTKKLSKYKLTVGMKFNSQKELSQKISVKEHTVSIWRSKGWIA